MLTTGSRTWHLSSAFGFMWIVGLALASDGIAGAAESARQDPAAAVAQVDLRPALKSWGLEPRVQGHRGTCSVFTVTGAIEYAVASLKGEGTRLSVEFLNWASNEAVGETEDGGYFSDLWKGFEAHGICPEADMPYQESYDPSRSPTDQAKDRAQPFQNLGLRLHWIKPWNPRTGLSETEFQAVKRALSQKWPVCGGFRWPKTERWQDDVLGMAPPEGVRDGHSVLLVGFQDDAKQPGGGLFIFRNSSRGGRDGFMTYEYARTYMNDAVWVDHGTTATSTPGDGSFGDLLGPLGAAPPGRNRRVSSNQQPEWNTENLDMNWILPGQSVEMPVLQGPGVITHIWFTSHAGWVGELNSLSLRIYWDGSEQPGVEVPLGDFFAVGQGKPAAVESIPVQVSPSGAMTCYWRMPFRKSARIVVTNDNPDRSTGLYWQVDWVQLDNLPNDTPYFYSRYRQENPAVAGQDYLIADLEGRGQYVGTVMSVTLGQDGWFGEGDDFFFIDGEKVPSLQGTGSEDYFNDAWGFRPRTGPWFGQPRWQGDQAGDSGVCYRWHLPDPVRFNKSLKVAIEHKGNRVESEDGFFLERPDFVSSVAFWYQTCQPKPFAPLRPWHERRVPWQAQHLVRAFRQAKASGDVKAQVQTLGFFGARPVLAWENQTPGATLTLPFEVAESGRYALRLTTANGPDYGVYDVQIDGKKVVQCDFRAKEYAEVDLSLAAHELSKGNHTITFQAVENAERTGPLAVEILRLLRLPTEAQRSVRTHHEAHFVRLGIGRAVYAYRLAYGELPDSLETLVKSGIMPAQYLKDENGRPLKARREGEYLVVESPAPNGWQHRWQGLDARR